MTSQIKNNVIENIIDCKQFCYLAQDSVKLGAIFFTEYG